MTILPIAPDYTDKDFEALNRRAETLISAVYPRWTSFNRADFGNLLKELFCYVGDVLTYYQDAQARETRWGTATRRESIIELARLVGGAMASPAAAIVALQVTIARSVSPGGAVVIPAGTVARTLDRAAPQRFQFLSDLTIPGGSTSGTVSAEHSESQDDAFAAAGTASEEFQLTQRPFLDATDAVVIGSDTWTRVASFISSAATDRHYTVITDAADYGRVRLGDGTNGSLAAAGAPVAVTYRTGGGAGGNVEAGTIVGLDQTTWYDSPGGATVQASVSNALAATGGADRETIASARERIPASLRVLNRCVARTDWEDAAIQVAGVARALLLTHLEVAGIPEGIGRLYVVPDGGGVPDVALLEAVQDFILAEYPGPACFEWAAWNPAYKTIDIRAYVYLAPDATAAGVEAAALTALRAFFAPCNADGSTNYQIDFGYNYKRPSVTPGEHPDPDPLVSLSTISGILLGVAGVRRLGTPSDGEGVLLEGAADDVELELWEFPAGGTLTLWDGDAGTIFAGHPVAI